MFILYQVIVKKMADTLIKVIIDYAKNNSIKKLWLNSSDEGKRIYLKNNFKEIENIMELCL